MTKFHEKLRIRGEGKAYILLEFEEPVHVVEGQEFLLAIEGNGNSILGEVIELFGQNELLLVFPLLEIEATLKLFARTDKTSELLWSCVVKPSELKWKSRINYRVHPSESESIKTAERLAQLNRSAINITNIIPVDGEEVIRGNVQTPYTDPSVDSIRIYNSSLEPLPITPTRMGTPHIITPPQRNVPLIRVDFSARVPGSLVNKIICYDDETDATHCAFLVVDEGLHEHFVHAHKQLTDHAAVAPGYDAWRKSHQASPDDLAIQWASTFQDEPLISVITVVSQNEVSQLAEMLESMQGQTYGKWEHVLVNTVPENEAITHVLRESAAKDQRIRIVDFEHASEIAQAVNVGIEACRGTFVGFLGQRGCLEPNALYECVDAYESEPTIDVIYTDEDVVTASGYQEPCFKPDFSLFFFRETNYIGNFLVIRKSLFNQIDCSGQPTEPAFRRQLLLACADKAQHIHHIPQVLYSTRAANDQSAETGETGQTPNEAERQVVEKHLANRGVAAAVESTSTSGKFHIRYEVEGTPRVSIIIPNKDNSSILKNCIDSILDKTHYSNFEIIIVENNSTENETFEFYQQLEKLDDRIKVVTWEGTGFNFATINNFGVEKSSGEYLLFLNNDTEIITPDWLSILLGLCQQPEVGAVGAKLLYPDMLIQHAGVVVQGIGAGHLALNLPGNTPGYLNTICSTHEVSAVTGACTMVERAIFNEVGGFDERYAVAFNDVDLCMKIREAGKLVLYTPLVELIHYESLSRGYETSKAHWVRFQKETMLLRYKWSNQFLFGDPYSNVNLDPYSVYHALPANAGS